MTQKVLSLIAVFMLIVSVNVFAQTPQNLRVGSSLNGELGSGQEIWYSVRPTSDGMLTVETSSNFDTYLEAFDANRNLITENDDGGENLNAKIDMVVRRNTTYLFKLRGYGSSSVGPFSIAASISPLPRMTDLRIDNAHSGNIETNVEYWFRVRPTQAGTLYVTTTGNTDTLLWGYDDNYNQLDYNDDYYINEYSDGNYDYNARIAFPVQPRGTYFIRLRAHSTGSGPYELTASFTEAARPARQSANAPTRDSIPNPVNLTIGSSLNGFIDNGNEFWYSVRATRRGRIIVQTSGSTDTFLEAYNDSFEMLTSNDDYEDLNARVEVQAEANRTYLFRLRGFSSSTTGAFRVTASMVN
ncbi:MAG: hypothetical protein FWC01_09020 [Treponema sp.]|nr:hypothetical protein [Treponema sp.]